MRSTVATARGIVIGLVLALGIGSLWAAIQHASITFPPDLQVEVPRCTLDFASGDLDCDLLYSVTATGSQMDVRHFKAPGNNGPIIDTQSGVQIAASVPVSVQTPRNDLMDAINAALVTAAAAGKFNR